MRDVPIQRARESHLVVGADARIVLPARHRHVCQPLIDELLARTCGLDVYQHAAGGLPLAAMARQSVAVIQMTSLAGLECGRSTGIPSDLHASGRVDALKLEITQRYLNITDVGVVPSMRELWGRRRAGKRAQA